LRRYRVRGGAEGMIGERVTVVEDCAPDGLVRVRGELWRASVESGGALGEGERGTVLAVDGLTVRIGRDI